MYSPNLPGVIPKAIPERSILKLSLNGILIPELVRRKFHLTNRTKNESGIKRRMIGK